MQELAPFAAIDALINQGMERHLANAVAVYGGGVPFGVLFDSAPQERFEGALDTATITAEFCVANTPGLAEGVTLVVGGVAYTVHGPVQPDAGGWVRVGLAPQ